PTRTSASTTASPSCPTMWWRAFARRSRARRSTSRCTRSWSDGRATMAEPVIETRAVPKAKPRRASLSVKDFKGKADPDWCPGCGDFGVLNALKTAIAELGLQPHEVLTISGIGCSSNLPGYINTYGMHTLHGRAIAVAPGASGQQKHLVQLIKGAMEHRGFALIDVLSPCVTYNKDNTHEFFKQRTQKLEEIGHDPTDLHAAIEKGNLWGDVIPIGLFY